MWAQTYGLPTYVQISLCVMVFVGIKDKSGHKSKRSTVGVRYLVVGYVDSTFIHLAYNVSAGFLGHIFRFISVMSSCNKC